jgi:hypothetical protein
MPSSKRYCFDILFCILLLEPAAGIIATVFIRTLTMVSLRIANLPIKDIFAKGPEKRRNWSASQIAHLLRKEHIIIIRFAFASPEGRRR